MTGEGRPTVVFLDRDGTLIQDVHYLARVEQVRLLDGAGEAVARLNRAGIPVVLVTNQSGIARGYFSVADYERAQERLASLLAERGAHLDASYYCPHHPDFGGACSCRKPGVLLFRQAADELRLDMTRAVGIGDRWRDLAPVIELGGAGILVVSSETPPDEVVRAEREAAVVPSLGETVARLLGGDAGFRA